MVRRVLRALLRRPDGSHFYVVVFVSIALWNGANQDGVVMTLFGNRHVGLFGEYAHWVPIIVPGLALALPWLVLVLADVRRRPAKNPGDGPN